MAGSAKATTADTTSVKRSGRRSSSLCFLWANRVADVDVDVETWAGGRELGVHAHSHAAVRVIVADRFRSRGLHLEPDAVAKTPAGDFAPRSQDGLDVVVEGQRLLQ